LAGKRKEMGGILFTEAKLILDQIILHPERADGFVLCIGKIVTNIAKGLKQKDPIGLAKGFQFFQNKIG